MRPLFTAMAYNAFSEGGASRRHRGAQRRGAAEGPRHGAPLLRRTAAAAIAAVAAAAVLAGTAHAAGSVFLPAPAYPSSALAIRVVGKPRAGGVARVVVSGSNAPFEAGYPGSGDDIAYQLDAFAQNGAVLPNCPRSFAEELQNEVNLGISRIAQGLNEGYFGPFGIPIQFRTSPRIRKVVVCAYSRMISDDAAVSALGFRLRRARR